MNAKHYDTIVIGAGHNGLVCAAYLARAGQRVLVLEAAAVPGGLAAEREFYPGFRAAAAHSVNHFPRKIIRELALESHGLEPRADTPRIVALGADGNHVVLREQAVTGVGEKDTAAYHEFVRLLRRFAAALAPSWLRTIPRVTPGNLAGLTAFARIGLRLRLLGRDDLREFMRMAALSARDLADEFFDDERLKAAVCWDALVGSKMAPRSPNNAVLPLLYRMSGGVRATPRALVGALHAAVAAAGAEVRTGAPVARVLVQADGGGLRTSGVELAGGEQIGASRIVSSADPQTTFFRLLGVHNLEIGFSNRIRRLRCEGYVAKLHLALDGPPAFTGLERTEGRLLTAPDMDAIEFAFDEAKYGEAPSRPVMEIAVPSLQDSGLAPPGQHVLSAHLMYVPCKRRGGWDAAARTALLDSALAELERFAPGIRAQMIHAELFTPADLEREYRVTGGHWHHTEFALDQALMMRPTYEAAQYRTPLPGLWLCGAGSHPGGDLTGMAGHNAARELLK